MRLRVSMILAAMFLCLTPVLGVAQLSSYGPQDFEAMGLTDRFALEDDGWFVFGNVYDPSFNFLYGYGPFVAPNSNAMGVPDAFSALTSGEGGLEQGDQQLSIFSDYQNLDHGNLNLVESNFYQEQTITGADIGSSWFFQFDAKLGNLVAPSTAMAFIKILDPDDDFALIDFRRVNMTNIPVEWNRYGIVFNIGSGLLGKVLQFGFSNTATNYDASGIFYDNVVFTNSTPLGVPQGLTAGSGLQLSVLGNPAVANAAQVLSFTIPRDSHVTVRVYNVGGGLVATLIDRELGAGPHSVSWQGRHATGQAAAKGIYFAEVVAGTERAVAKLSRPR